ncbi:MAG: fasciclin domain-containing protein [Anaerolineae bacterium]|nr:fasciclin domain-containing protein [Anaerolineae bacterium]
MHKLTGVFIFVTLMIAALTPGFAQENEPGTLADVVTAAAEAETPEFTSLLAALQAADASVLEALSDAEAEYTVFAPNDEAFAALGEETPDSEQLTDLLLYHVVEGKFLAADLTDGQTLETLQGQPLTVSVEGETIFVNGAEIISADMEASNGVIHTLNTVLELPEQAATAEAVEGAATAEATESATAEATQAATEEATAATAEATEAVVSEGQATAEATQVATEEVTAATAEATQAATEEATEAAAAAEGQATETPAEETQGTPVPELIKPGTVADTVLQAASSAEAPEFTYLLAMILASEPTVVELLSNENASVTVFAPTDAAINELISALGIDEFSTIISNQEALTNLLLYHVVDGQSLSADLVSLNGQTIATMLAGQSLEITTDEAGTLLINGIPVLTSDVQASNGVIHVINGVLIPAEGE